MRQRFAPFGNLVAYGQATGCAAEDRAFVGERRDADTKLLDLNARWYNPTTSLFLTPDWLDPVDGDTARAGAPVGWRTNPVGTNRYAYAGQDPINKSDPGGQLSVSCTAGGSKGVGSCSSSDDGDKNNINVTLRYTTIVDGQPVTKTSTNSYSASHVEFGQIHGAGLNSIIKSQASAAFGVDFKLDQDYQVEFESRARSESHRSNDSLGSRIWQSMAGMWGGSGGGGERGRGSNRLDRKQVDYVAREQGVTDRSGFGNYIESAKRSEGRRGDENYTIDDLRDLAREFKQNGGR